jgi:hypothetical protein
MSPRKNVTCGKGLMLTVAAMAASFQRNAVAATGLLHGMDTVTGQRAVSETKGCECAHVSAKGFRRRQPLLAGRAVLAGPVDAAR